MAVRWWTYLGNAFILVLVTQKQPTFPPTYLLVYLPTRCKLRGPFKSRGGHGKECHWRLSRRNLPLCFPTCIYIFLSTYLLKTTDWLAFHHQEIAGPSSTTGRQGGQRRWRRWKYLGNTQPPVPARPAHSQHLRISFPATLLHVL